MNLRQVLELIPADNLHYSDVEKAWRVFSDEQYQQMVSLLEENDVSIEGMMLFLHNAKEARVLTILLDRLFKDEVTFYVNEDGEMKWVTK